jgi:hypothetical protein
MIARHDGRGEGNGRPGKRFIRVSEIKARREGNHP